ncbi:MAG: hypothetical protein ACE5I5_18165 [Candidatus Heimdallarchaeota archaeon]
MTTNLFSILQAPKPDDNAQFGNSVAIEGDFVVIGEKLADMGDKRNTGRAYIIPLPEITPATTPETTTIITPATTPETTPVEISEFSGLNGLLTLLIAIVILSLLLRRRRKLDD